MARRRGSAGLPGPPGAGRDRRGGDCGYGGGNCVKTLRFPVDKGKKRRYNTVIKSDDGEEAVHQRPKRGMSRLKASCPRHGLYHSRAACEEQDGRFPLKEPKATAAKP